jgi:hypothetical protein
MFSSSTNDDDDDDDETKTENTEQEFKNLLSATQSVSELAQNFFDAFPKSDRDDHTQNLQEHIRVWLLVTVFTVVPAILHVIPRDQHSLLWTHVPFFTSHDLFTCYKVMTLSMPFFIFFGQLFGFITNKWT